MKYLDSCLCKNHGDTKWSEGTFIGYVAGGAVTDKGVYLCMVKGVESRFDECKERK